VSQTLDLIIAAKGNTDAAFAQLQAGLGGIDTKLKTLTPSLGAFEQMTQKQRQALERAHESALKMNDGLNKSDDQAQKTSAAIGAMSSTVAKATATFGLSAAGLGVNAQQLAAVGTAGDLAAIKLKGTAAGFNATSFAVAGAGLAIGAAIGGWLRTFPEVSKAADDAAEALVRLFTAQKDIDAQANRTQGLAKWQAEMAASAEAASKKQVETLRGMGRSVSQILDTLDGRTKTSHESTIEGLRREEAALKKFNEEQRRAAELAAKVAEKIAASLANAKVTWTGFFSQIPNAIKPAEVAVFDFSQQIDLLAEAAKKPKQPIIEVREVVDDLTAALLRMEEGNALERFLAWAGIATAEKGLAVLAGTLRELDGLFEALGVSADSSLRIVVAGFAEAAQGASDFLRGLESGNPAAVISGLTSMFVGLKDAVDELTGGDAEFGFNLFGPHEFTAAERMTHQLMVLRTEFINMAGGLNQLEADAAAAGVSLDAMWNARTVEEYERAINDVNAAIALHESAIDKTKEAMERWGLTAADMGPKFAQGMLHEALASIYQDLLLLEAGGADVAALLAGPMGDSIQGLVQQAQASGAALPEFMREWIQKLIDSHDLIDANGDAITDVSQLTFTESLEAGVARLIDAVHDLVDALLGIHPIEVGVSYKVHGPIPAGVPGGPGAGVGGNVVGGGHYEQQHAAAGGWFPFRAGGYNVKVGEAGDEAIIPKDKMAGIVAQAMTMAGGGGSGDINLTIPVYIGGDKLDTVFIRRKRAGFLAMV
jgi:hypothetical protein